MLKAGMDFQPFRKREEYNDKIDIMGTDMIREQRITKNQL